MDQVPPEGGWESVKENLPLNVVLPFGPNDQVAAVNWLHWCSDLCAHDQTHTIWLLPFKDIDPSEAQEKAAKCFADVKIINDPSGIQSRWREEKRDSSGPNSMFRTAVFHFCKKNIGPWFFCEPDCIPLKPSWIDALEKEYYSVGLPFMGVKINAPPHLNGVAIYPWDTPARATRLIVPVEFKNGGEVGWDVIAGPEVVDKAHGTKLIHFVYPSHPVSDDEFIDPEAVLYHSNNDGSLINLLRKKWREGISQ